MSEEAVVAGTRRGWGHWLAHCDALGGRDLSHKEIARALGEADISHWWCQMVTVGYERMIGRREQGQSCTGDFTAGASRTVPGDMDSSLAAWCDRVKGRTAFAEATAAAEPRITSSERWRYWRVDLDDGTRATVMFSDKPGGKTTIAVNHEKLADAEAVAAAKAFWKDLLAEV